MSNSKMVILIIDDDVDLLKSVAKNVASFGYETKMAATVEEVEPLLTQVDGVLADVNMPGKDRLNDILSHCDVPVVRYSAQPQFVLNFMLKKPFTRAKLKEALDYLSMCRRDSGKMAA